MADFNISVSASELNTAITKANAAAPQSTTYTKSETNALLAPYSGIEETDDNYIELKSGVRLYITDTTPTGTIPVGSIGIGF